MVATLDKNAHKVHWSTQELQFLLKRVHEELIELRGAGVSGNADRICAEAVDVMCIAMMIFDKYKDRRVPPA